MIRYLRNFLKDYPSHDKEEARRVYSEAESSRESNMDSMERLDKEAVRAVLLFVGLIVLFGLIALVVGYFNSAT